MTSTPTLFGRLDNFQSFNFGNKVNDYGIKMQAYFVPPTDGKNQFILVADDVGKLYKAVKMRRKSMRLFM